MARFLTTADRRRRGLLVGVLSFSVLVASAGAGSLRDPRRSGSSLDDLRLTAKVVAEGVVIETDGNTFRVDGADGSATLVRVEGRTRWEGGPQNVADVLPGMWVHVEGRWSSGEVIASLVQVDLPPPANQVWLLALVETVDSAWFTTASDSGPVTVVVGDETVWGNGLVGVEDLFEGLWVVVEGMWSNGQVDASRVAIGDDPGGPVSVACGIVQWTTDSDFGLLPDGGVDPIEVEPGPATLWSGGISGVDDLLPDMWVCVDGELTDGVLTAWMVNGVEDPGPPMEMVDGTVIEVAATSFVILSTELGGPFTVAVDQRTDWLGVADEVQDLEPGAWVEAHGERVGEDILQAMLVHVPGPEPPTPALAQGPVLALEPGSFVVNAVATLGSAVTVTVDEHTVWSDGLTAEEDLVVGQSVVVSGLLEPASSVLVADVVWGTEAGQSPGVLFESFGEVLDVDSDVFVLSDQRAYVIDEGTTFDPGFEGTPGLIPGQFVRVVATRRSDQTNLALSVEYHGEGGTGQHFELVLGTVWSADVASITLQEGIVVSHDAATVWTGDADHWSSLARGWLVEISAFLGVDGTLLATEVRADNGGPGDLGGQEWQEGEALVVLEAGADALDVAARHGAMLAGEVEGVAFLLRWPMELDDVLLAWLDADPAVRAVEPNYRVRDLESVRRRYVVIDREGGSERFLTQSAGAVIGLPGDESTARGEGVVVAVLDTGVDPDHPTLAGRLEPGGLDLVDEDYEPWEERNLLDDDEDGDVDEAAGHGTFVASLIALVAPEAHILPYRVLDDDGGGTTFSLAVALAAAIQAEVDVVNVSLTYQRRSVAIDILLERAAERDIVVVVASGNDGLDTVPFLASDSHVLAVTGSDAAGEALADFANRSDLVVMAAPAVDVYGGVDGQRWATWSGTSLAAPFVSGSVARLLSLDSGLDRQLVGATLEQGGQPLTDQSWRGRLLDLGASLALVAGETAQPGAP